MYTFQNLEITHILPTKEGIFAYAKYPNWWQEFSFFIKPDGKVIGKTHEGSWLEVSGQLSEYINAKVKFILSENPSLIYA